MSAAACAHDGMVVVKENAWGREFLVTCECGETVKITSDELEEAGYRKSKGLGEFGSSPVVRLAREKFGALRA